MIFQSFPLACAPTAHCATADRFAQTKEAVVGEFLSAENKKQLWIPEGFAHGFFVLSTHAEVIYKVCSFYKNEFERSIKWNDPDLGIDWLNNGTTPLLSIKDSNASEFSKAELFE